MIAGAAAEQNVWTRSANRNNGNNTFIVNTSGNVNNNNAQNALRCAPDRTGESPTEACGAAAERGETGAGSRDPEPERAGATPTRLERGRLSRAPDPHQNWNPAS